MDRNDSAGDTLDEVQENTKLIKLTDHKNDLRDRNSADFSLAFGESPEATAFCCSRLFFCWLNPLLKKGYEGEIVERDLNYLREKDKSSRITNICLNAWREQGQMKRASFLKVLRKSFCGRFFFAGLLKLTFDISVFATPLIISELIRFTDSDQSQTWGLYLVALMFSIQFVGTLILHQYFTIVFRLGMYARAATIAMIYCKIFRLSCTSRASTNSGEIQNLVTTDAQSLRQQMTYLWLAVSSWVQIALATYLIYRYIGISMVIGLSSLFFFLMPIMIYIRGKIQKSQKALQECRDLKLKIISEVLQGIRAVKYYAWEPSFYRKIEEKRTEELSALKKWKYWEVSTGLLWSIAPLLLIGVSFTSFIMLNGRLTADRAFTTICLFEIIKFPLIMFPMVFIGIIRLKVALDRVSEFLNLPELEPSWVGDSVERSVIMKDASFSWDDDGVHPALREVSFCAIGGQNIAVCGSVGTGKTAFLSSLFGELHCTSKPPGIMMYPFHVAFAAQIPWIQNATVRENITGDVSNYEQAWYHKVISASALLPDFQALPRGDLTEIGDKGVNLSGGQKQRVAIARAVYRAGIRDPWKSVKANMMDTLLLLDDPFSALDPEVTNHIFKELVFDLSKCATIILATNNTGIVKRCDSALLLGMGGYTKFQGTPEELFALGRISAFISPDTDKGGSVEELIDPATDFQTKATSSENVEISECKPSTSTDGNMHKTSTERKQMQEEEQHVGNVEWAVYRQYLKSGGGMPMFALLIFFLLIAACCNGGVRFWLAYWVDTDSDGKSFYYLSIFLAIIGAQFVLSTVPNFVMVFFTLSASSKIHGALLHSVMKLKTSFFDVTPIGRILTRFSEDIYQIDELVPKNLQHAATITVSCLVVFAICALVVPTFLIMLFPVGIFFLAIQRYYIRTSRSLKRWLGVLSAPIFSNLSESITGCSTIRAFKIEESFIEKQHNLLDAEMRAYWPSVSLNRWLAIRLEVSGNLLISTTALSCVLFRDSLSPGLVGLALSMVANITQSLNWVVRMYTELEENIVSVERVKQYDVPENHERPIRISEMSPPKGWPDKGHLLIKDLTVRYRKELDCVLKGVNLEIQPGEWIGLCGRTGSGKSSILLSLLRIVEPEQGSQIILDGVDVLQIGLHDLRNVISVIPQDSVLFTGSIRFNLDPFEEKTEEELWEVIKMAKLHDLVNELEHGLESEVEEGGANFSAGQRQLFCLARAMLRKDAKLLLLDEATSTVDNETDKFIQAAIRERFKDTTVLVIAHRINTILDCNRICVLDDGDIIECGSPDELMKNPGSNFRRVSQEYYGSQVKAT